LHTRDTTVDTIAPSHSANGMRHQFKDPHVLTIVEFEDRIAWDGMEDSDAGRLLGPWIFANSDRAEERLCDYVMDLISRKHNFNQYLDNGNLYRYMCTQQDDDRYALKSDCSRRVSVQIAPRFQRDLVRLLQLLDILKPLVIPRFMTWKLEPLVIEQKFVSTMEDIQATSFKDDEKTSHTTDKACDPTTDAATAATAASETSVKSAPNVTESLRHIVQGDQVGTTKMTVPPILIPHDSPCTTPCATTLMPHSVDMEEDDKDYIPSWQVDAVATCTTRDNRKRARSIATTVATTNSNGKTQTHCHTSWIVQQSPTHAKRRKLQLVTNLP
jgi:hypothetical protein